MADVFRGQTGTSVLVLFDDEGRETRMFDRVVGITYESSDPAVATIVDEDAEPQDAEIATHAVGSAQFKARLDGDPDEEVRELVFQSEVINVLEPPPGEAVTGTFTVTWRPVAPE